MPIIDRRVTVIIPAYNQLPTVRNCVASCKKYVDARHTILVIDDASAESNFARQIRITLEHMPNARYVRNTANLGFVKTCNRAVFDIDATDNDILLLNADAELTEGSVEEMLSCLYLNDRTGVCCPRSNHATILSFPPLSEDPRTPDLSYTQWNMLKNHLPRTARLPTGVGFCMMIRRELIKRFGLFDPIYGKGYNEENDFCMRINRYGYSIVMANRAFVFHHDIPSFTPAEKIRLEERHSAVLNERFPEYRRRVGEYERWERSGAEYFAEILSPRTNRKKILIDLSHLHAVYNGTSQYVLELLVELVPRLTKQCDAHILIRPIVDAFFGISKRYKNIHYPDAGVCPLFDLVFVPQQIFHMGHLALLNRLGVRIVSTVHDVIALRCGQLCTTHMNIAFRESIRFCDGIITVSKTTLADIEDAFYSILQKRPSLPRRVIYNGANTSRDDRHVLPLESTIPLDRDFLLLIGNHFAHKAIEFALKHIPKDQGVIVLADKKPTYTERQRTWNLRSGAVHPSLMRALYTQCAAVLFPSQYESCGLPILHASFYGKPVIVQDLPVTREVTQEYGIEEYVFPCARWNDLPAILQRARAAAPSLLPKHHERSWAVCGAETAGALLTILDQPADVDALEQRFSALKTLEFFHEQQEVASFVGKKLRRFPQTKSFVKKVLQRAGLLE
ncbi:glycosyltransferase [Candidatus Peregrinibacteria bacterium]|nr:glycosyltransferase [Candidatus Peregrinibacteria bacterium]